MFQIRGETVQRQSRWRMVSSCHCLTCADQGLSPPPPIAGLIILRNGTALISDQCKRATFTVATPCHYTD